MATVESAARVHRVTPPLSPELVQEIRSGDRLLITGKMYTARDAAHKRLTEALERGEPLPVDIVGQVIYYVGPTPPKPGQVIGSAGPTTSGRMDKYTPALLAQGLRAAIGKGYRSEEVRRALVEHGGLYLAATGGAGALLAKRIKAAKVVAYDDLGPEAIRELEVEDFPVVVIHDAHGGDLYAEGQKTWRKG